ncbi:MAG: Pterin-4-alpha-carbinolamine dehydratase [Thermomicrobiales bacterium]|nr:Pterin-4-alpha-carbinolamine dehydratase [Thermomicrobiales bacterium]
MIGNRKNELKGLAMTEELTQKVCTPCQGGIPPLTHEEAAQHLGLVQGWELLDDARRIERTDRFKNFWEALAFVQGFGELAEAEGAPPERLVSLQTKKIKGLHENDFIMAAKINRWAGGGDPAGDRGPPLKHRA